MKLTEVTSPTFNLLNEYQINQIKINHYDLFRLKSVEEIKSALERDNFMTAETAKLFGLIDEVVEKRS